MLPARGSHHMLCSRRCCTLRLFVCVSAGSIESRQLRVASGVVAVQGRRRSRSARRQFKGEWSNVLHLLVHQQLSCPRWMKDGIVRGDCTWREAVRTVWWESMEGRRGRGFPSCWCLPRGDWKVLLCTAPAFEPGLRLQITPSNPLKPTSLLVLASNNLWRVIILHIRCAKHLSHKSRQPALWERSTAHMPKNQTRPNTLRQCHRVNVHHK